MARWEYPDALVEGCGAKNFYKSVCETHRSYGLLFTAQFDPEKSRSEKYPFLPDYNLLSSVDHKKFFIAG
ncbi:hypothetical protein WA026_003959 [Henosepilachna vigintioctopunctata]|uniref:Uncharacterized protein n=1 Tax=Henosepilachna vigintioctopunctata TaxID=420089 RepID=A0AAW1U653_9CUCU